MLGKLLKSKNAEDLRAANRLIRDMVRRVSIIKLHACIMKSCLLGGTSVVSGYIVTFTASV